MLVLNLRGDLFSALYVTKTVSVAPGFIAWVGYLRPVQLHDVIIWCMHRSASPVFVNVKKHSLTGASFVICPKSIVVLSNFIPAFLPSCACVPIASVIASKMNNVFFIICVFLLIINAKLYLFTSYNLKYTFFNLALPVLHL